MALWQAWAQEALVLMARQNIMQCSMGRARNGAVKTRHWALDRRAYRHRCELGILSLGCVGADGLALIHTSTGKWSHGWVKGEDGAAYIMLNLAGETASLPINTPS